jgi:choline dehydrogenase
LLTSTSGGYFPGYSVNATANHNWFSWALLKAHPRNTAGSVTLRSADPLDMPNIVYNYFDTGVGDYDADLQAMYEAIQVARDAFASQLVPVEEISPGIDYQSAEAVKQYVKGMHPISPSTPEIMTILTSA